MGTNKAFLRVGGVALWRRQLSLLQQLQPHELFISGVTHHEWAQTGCQILGDAAVDAGPLAGVTAALRRCSTPLLLVLAVDLPCMTADCLKALVDAASETTGAVPAGQPLAAIYPRRAIGVAEKCLASHKYAMQEFVATCAVDGLVAVLQSSACDDACFFNMNTAQDLIVAEAAFNAKR